MTSTTDRLDDSLGWSTVFVYGSLKRGFHNHVLLGDPEGSQFLGRTHVTGRFRLLDMKAYPGLIKHTSFPEAMIVGELFRVTQDVLKSLDILEGNRVYYTRSKVPSGSGMRAWCYFLPFSESVRDSRSDLDSSRIQCWRPTPEESAYMLTLGATSVDAPSINTVQASSR